MKSHERAIMKFSRKAICICLTATAQESHTGGIERSVLRKMEFKIWDDIITLPHYEPNVPSFTKLGAMEEDRILEFLNAETDSQAVLIYCDVVFKEKLKDRFESYVVVDE